MSDLAGKTILITGGSRGLGRSITQELADAGANTLIADVVEPDELPHGGSFRHLDVTSQHEWHILAEHLQRHHDRIDGLVNNAGILKSRGSAGRLQHITLEDWNALLTVNTTGSFLAIQTIAPLMGRGGSIVNISSIAAGGAHMAAGYSVSKWALRGLSHLASMELGPAGIRVNSIMPGYLETSMQNDSPPGFADAWASIVPLGRVGRPGDVAPIVAFLLSDEAAWISGADISVDGGALSHGGLKVISDAMAQGLGEA